MANIIETLTELGEFNILIELINVSGFDETLNGNGPFTLFAPNDTAFAKLGEKEVAQFKNDQRKAEAVVAFHIVAGAIKSEDLKTGELPTLLGASEDEDLSIGIYVEDGSITVGNGIIIKADIDTDNGVVHVVDSVSR